MIGRKEELQRQERVESGEGQGNFDYLENTALEIFGRKIRANSRSFIGGEDEEV